MFVVFMDFVVVEKWYNIGNLSIVSPVLIFTTVYLPTAQNTGMRFQENEWKI